MNVFDLFARILFNTDDYDRNLDDAGKRAQSFGETLKKGIGAAAKVSAAAITATSAAVGVLVKQSVDGYAEFEQLVGGVETLFKASSDLVTEYANNAYQTAGLSANEYMDTVTSFSASLLQGLAGDTYAAARTADLAITDMADNANKMGTAMDSIQNAYQGFAKQNYTMLDNLKLGYGGTQEEMARLINDSGVLGNTMKVTAKTVNQVSFDKIIEAIHVVQTGMGITGTTALEASTTIQGSVASAKSAWANLVTGIADENADLSGLIGKFTESVATAAGNIIPRITQILSGIGTAVQSLSPVIAQQVPALIADVLPSIISAGGQLLVGLTTGLIAALPELASAVPNIVGALSTALSDSLPSIMEAGTQLLSMMQNGIVSALPTLTPTAISAVLQFVDSVTEPGTLGTVADAALEIILSLADGLISSLPELIEKAPEIIGNLVDAIVENVPKLLQGSAQIISMLADGIISNLPELGNAAGQIIGKIVSGAMDLISDIWEIGGNIVTGVWNGIQEKAEWLKEQVKGFFTGIVDGVKSVLGIHSPSKVFREEVGQYMALGVAEGISDKADKAVKAADKLAKDVYSRSKDWADKNVKYMELSLSEQVELWETIQNQFVKGSKQYADAEERIFDLRAQALEEYQKRAESVYSKNEALEKEYQDTLTKRTVEIYNSFGLFDEIPERQKVSGADLMENLRDQIDSIQEFHDGLTQLEERGVVIELVDEIRDMGVEAADELAALLSLTDEQLSEYSELYGEKQSLANDIAMEELEGLRTQTDARIQENLNSLEALYDSETPSVGAAFTDGLAEGIMGGISTVIGAAVSVAQAAVDATKSTLGIHSPSRVFAGIGGNMALGLAEGWEDELSSVRNRITQGMDFGTANIDFASSGLGLSSAAIINSASGAGAGANGPISLTIPVMLPDGSVLAKAMLSDLIKAASAAGTPFISTGYA